MKSVLLATPRLSILWRHALTIAAAFSLTDHALALGGPACAGPAAMNTKDGQQVEKDGQLYQIKCGFHILISHKKGCIRDPSRRWNETYRPQQSPECREQAEPAVFPNPSVPPIRWPQARSQDHGIDLSKRDEETAMKYFHWLCENESGSWVYKQIKDVEGIFAMRNRPDYYDPVWQIVDRYYLEDPWSQTRTLRQTVFPQQIRNAKQIIMPTDIWGQTWGGYGYTHYLPHRGYEFFERPLTAEERKKYPGFKYMRYSRVWPKEPYYQTDYNDEVGPERARTPAEVEAWMKENGGHINGDAFPRLKGEIWLWGKIGEDLTPIATPTNELKSRYGWLWRGIERNPAERELGIGGGEEIVVDLKTNEVLGVRRAFKFARQAWTASGPKGAAAWQIGYNCFAQPEAVVEKTLNPRDPYKARNVNPATTPRPPVVEPPPRYEPPRMRADKLTTPS